LCLNLIKALRNPQRQGIFWNMLHLRLWDDFRTDLRYALRILIKSPGFTAIAIGSLALGIGANTVIFTFAKQVLFDRLAVPHPEELRLLMWTAPERSIVENQSGDLPSVPGGQHSPFPYPIYQLLRGQNQVLGDLFAFKSAGLLSATIGDDAVVLQGQMVSGNYYQELGVHPALGRPITPSDDAVAGSGAVATISHEAWTRYFDGSPSVIGKTITLNGNLIVIIGVNPPHFTGASDPHVSPDIFLPLSMQPELAPLGQGSLLNDKEFWWVQIMARSKSGTPVPMAQSSLDTLFQSLLLAGANADKHKAIPHLLLSDGSRGLNMSALTLTKPMYVLLALVGLVLLLACVNIANLLLARSAMRQGEMAVRIALGAGRTRVLRQMLTESLLLSLLGGTAGLVVSYPGRNALLHLLSPPWGRVVFNGEFDQRVFVFTVGISILAGLLFGLAPAWKAIRTEANPELKEQTQSVAYRRKGLAGKLIVSFQVALSTLLVVGAALFVRTLVNLNSVEPGFRTDHLLLFRIQLSRVLYPPPKDVILFRNIEEKLNAIPGVESVTLSSAPLLANSVSTNTFIRLDQPHGPQNANAQDAWRNTVGQSFFSALGIPIIAGRGFNSTDTDTSPKVAVINQALARQYFSDANPIGKRFRGYYLADQVPFEIVGICGDAHYDNLRRQPPPTYYVLYHQLLRSPGGMTYEVRTQITPSSLVQVLRTTVQSVDKSLPMVGVHTQDEQIRSITQQERLLAGLTAGFGILALMLACIGIYGIMAYTVARRTNEIGIRLALGAQTQKILEMILNEAFQMTVAGIVAGLSIAFLLARFLRSMLFGLEPDDPITFVSVALLLMAVALLAAFVPALRASRVEPIQALRHE